MRRGILAWCVWLWSIVLVSAADAQPAPSERRVAMVIGERVYDGAEYRSLKNAENDARQVMYALADAGFHIFDQQSGLMLDCDRERGRCAPLASVTSVQLRHALAAFTAAAAGADVALIYYSGHGISQAGNSYLVPSTDGPPTRGDYIPVLDLVRALVPARRDRILVIDACRSAGSARDAFVPHDISATADGSFVKLYQLFATQNGNPSYDSSPYTTDQSPFSAAFAKAVRMPGSTLDQVTRNVQRDVSEATRSYDKQQYPMAINQLGGNFAFVPTAAVRDAPLATPVFGDGMLATRDDADLVRLAFQKESAKSLESKASAGDYSAAYILSYYYHEQENDGAALRWAEEAARSNTPAGRHVLAMMTYYRRAEAAEQKGLGVGKVTMGGETPEAIETARKTVLVKSLRDNLPFPKSDYKFSLWNDAIQGDAYWDYVDKAIDSGVQEAVMDYAHSASIERVRKSTDRARRVARALGEFGAEASLISLNECKIALALTGSWDQPECRPDRLAAFEDVRLRLGRVRIWGDGTWGKVALTAARDYAEGKRLLKEVADGDSRSSLSAAYYFAYMFYDGVNTPDRNGVTIASNVELARRWKGHGLELCKKFEDAHCADLGKLPQ